MTASLFGLPVAFTNEWIFNAYVLTTSGGLVVVDPGLPVVADRVRTLIETELDRSVTDIDVVACTHGHPDHVGGVATLTTGLGADIGLPETCRAYLDGDRPRTFPVLESSLRFMSMYREQAFSLAALREFASLGRRVGFGGPPMLTLDFEPTCFLTDGGDLGRAEGWEIVHAPGHTDDSTCLYHRESATLISGDAVVTQDGRAWFNPEWVDLEASKQTEERLRSLEVHHLLPGHGQPIAAPDVWETARTSTDKPTGNSLLAKCSRRWARWPSA